MDNTDKELSYRLDRQIRNYAKRLAFITNPSLEEDYVQDMLVLWLEFDFDNEALLWTAIKHEMSDIVFRSRKYKYSLSKLRFLSFEAISQNHSDSITKDVEKLFLEYNIHSSFFTVPPSTIEDVVILNELLSFLSDREKMSLVLTFGYGYKGREVGELLGVTRSMISRYRSKALKKIRRKLNGG